jgi:hypothetical protein
MPPFFLRAPCRVCPLLLFGLCATNGCFPAEPAPEGTCAVDTQALVDCRAPGYTTDLEDSGLSGYTCSGSMRPDLDAHFVQGVPEGLVCSDKGALADGTEGYCCTSQPTDCAYDPVAACKDGSFGYQCRGSNRPDSLNPTLSCGNGVREGTLVDYCCSGTAAPALCQQSDTLGCSTRLFGFLCQTGGFPSGEDLGSNESRADFVHPVCSTPKLAPNPNYSIFCCYMPAPLAVRASCVNDTVVPGCAPGRFGFACYGPDTPGDDYLPMSCPEAPVEGVSAEGYQAKLYCCDFG